MSMEDEKIMTVADSTYGLMSLLLVYTGYLRVTQYGKGWEFYQHECVLYFESFSGSDPDPDRDPALALTLNLALAWPIKFNSL